MPALAVFVVHAPTSSYDENEIETFYMSLEKFYRGNHTIFKVTVSDFNAKIGPRRTPKELHIGTHGLLWTGQEEKLSEFVMTTKTIHCNSQFQKSTSLRWTWESPSREYHDDHIIINQRPDRRRCCAEITPSTDLKFVRRQFNRVMAKERKCSFLVERFNSLRSSPNPSCFALQHDLNEVDMGEDATEIGCREAMRYRILHKKFVLC
ncbi:hypothetical protein Y032_0068g139 [Ancylostoma ceylanicum]|uniref:Endonuclease/exonuclease/phosphatase domain-containing protein n=1 Tax=Ancylostoma ceylanicum TaxID=53326 RepID=A0A016TYA3_9BILA|nr:hypothetical protein Y032_0068g139 [Ancylostoma ceylanicum]